MESLGQFSAGNRGTSPAEGSREQLKRTTFSGRLVCSLQALGIGWLVSGIVFFVITKGPSGIAAWCIWGTAFFAVGWVLVGLPLIALGEQVCHLPYLLLSMAGGLGGALVMLLPTILFGFYNPPGVHWKYSLSDFKWEGIAFVIAAPTTALYRLFLDQKCNANKGSSQ